MAQCGAKDAMLGTLRMNLAADLYSNIMMDQVRIGRAKAAKEADPLGLGESTGPVNIELDPMSAIKFAFSMADQFVGFVAKG